MELHATLSAAESAREAARSGDYTRAVAVAATLVPGMEMQLEQFRLQMEAHDQALAAKNWPRAFRALADARLAALAAGLPELERVANEHMYELVKHHEVKGS